LAINRLTYYIFGCQCAYPVVQAGRLAMHIFALQLLFTL